MEDFSQQVWNERLREDARALIHLAWREDLDRQHDCTTLALVPAQTPAAALVVARESGVLAGVEVAKLVLEEWKLPAAWETRANDGETVSSGQIIARLAGPARDLLTAERTILNFLGRLSGIASLTRKYVEAIAGTQARVYDTRKTAPGWRRLEKYAVHCGGGSNHRTGLFDAILIKDNHLALGSQANLRARFSPAAAVRQARAYLALLVERGELKQPIPLEIELDSLADFEAVLAAQPDIILLDNMSPDLLRHAVERRDRLNSPVELEASGGVRLTTIRALAETGVERISCGALTHSAVNFDVALDWESA